MNRLFCKILKSFRGKRGSTMVGVLAAMVFITVVTAFMVKNTGAQSAASIGYGTSMALHSTVNSGFFATETVLSNDNSVVAGHVLDVIKKVHAKDMSNPFLPSLGSTSGANKMVALGGSSEQFFSSKLNRIVTGTNYLATVEVNSGVKGAGKSLKRALVFYTLDNLGETRAMVEKADTIKRCPNVPETVSGSNNAVYMAGRLQDGNNGMEVVGGATFEEEVRFQNKQAIFHGEAFFKENVYFLANAGYVFEGNTYFNANVTFQNMNPSTMFKASVGVNKNLLADNMTVNVPGDFFTNGNFSSTTTNVKGTGSGKKAYYTNNFTANLNQLDYNPKSKQDTLMDIPKLMGMKSIDERRETSLVAFDELVNKIKAKFPSGTTIRDVSTVMASTGDLRQLDMTKLNNAYIADSIAGKLYEEHMVVLIDYPNKYDEFKTHGLNGTTFEKKVIFLLKSGKLASNGSFYCSSPESSTMIYVGENGQLQEFGSTCLFRGYIYIDVTNTSTENGFYWGTNSSIEGAYHNFSTKQFKWNFNGTGEPTKITYNAAVLAPFFTLKRGYVPGTGGGGSTNETVTSSDGCTYDITKTQTPSGALTIDREDATKGFSPIPKGYYFY
ncbi:MAG: hypothetical protein LBC59_01575 [Chitinispirillales bacterium]|nr:hypothetical protein [Chitinispirillales bacterium]